jgi:inositol 1,4,5-triphosphate receptor type 3
VFSIETLVKFIFNTMLDDEVKATLLELLRALYIDREPHTVQVKPNLVRVVNLSSKKDEGAQLTHWNFIIYGQVFEKMFLYEDEDNHIGINRHDENELGKFIQGLKVELLNYLMRKCDFLSANMPPENVYNAMTLEVLNVLYMVLQFGLFQSRN